MEYCLYCAGFKEKNHLCNKICLVCGHFINNNLHCVNKCYKPIRSSLLSDNKFMDMINTNKKGKNG